MLEGISSLVAVVPVIAKADTHTAPELEAYRREVLQVGRELPQGMRGWGLSVLRCVTWWCDSAVCLLNPGLCCL